MANTSPENIDVFLSNAKDPDAFSELIRLSYGEIRRIATHLFRRERPDQTLQPTALTHELYLRLRESGPGRYENRAQFFFIVTREMRRILIERMRYRTAQKRGGDAQRVPLDKVQAGYCEPDHLAIDQAVSRLSAIDARMGQIVDLHFYGGFTCEEIAELLHMGESTVRKEWSIAKAWLQAALGEPAR
jgi:RNA polymerase sigma factor (TIGR02999 family)